MNPLELVAEEETKQFYLMANATTAPFDRDMKLGDLLEYQAEQTPEATALTGIGFRMSYRQLNERVNRLARTLRKRGIGPGIIAAVMAERSAEMIVGILAVSKAGGAYLPVDPNDPETRIAYLLDDSRARAVLVQSEFCARPELAGGREFINLDEPSSYSEDASNLERTGSPEDLAYVIYTSGSTGNPKGVMIEHRSVVNRLGWMQQAYPLTDTDVLMQKTPISFDVSVWELFRWMLAGASLFLLAPGDEKDPEAIAEAIEARGITVMHFVPSMLSTFLEDLEEKGRPERLHTLRLVFASGEALGVHQVAKFNELLHGENGTELIHLYGPAEATGDVTHFRCTFEHNYPTIPIGKPINNTRLYVVNDDFVPQPPGVEGELCIAGECLARGYLHREELTREKFVIRPFPGEERIYRTGDLACWLPDGNIEYRGRIDRAGCFYKPLPRAENRQAYPMTEEQKRIFIRSRMDPDSTAYNTPLVFGVQGVPDYDRLYEAVLLLTERHDSLRTSFEIVNEEPVQMIRAQALVDFDLIEGLTGEQPDPYVQAFVQPFDLAAAPLFRLRLVILPGQRSLLLMDIHHLISDGASTNVLLEELSQLYNGHELPPPAAAYLDYTVWSSDSANTTDSREDERFWLEILSGELPVLNFLPDYPRPKIRSLKGSKLFFHIGSDIKSKLEELALKEQATVYMVLVAAFKVLLHKYTGQEDLVIGTPAANRSHPDTLRTVGLFENTLPLRTRIDPEQTFADYLRHVREAVLLAYDHQHYLFDSMVEKLDIERDSGRNPVFDVMFVMENIDLSLLRLDGIQVNPLPCDPGISKFDLTLIAVPKEHGINFEMEYCTCLFDSGTMEQFCGHYLNVLEIICRS